MTEVIEDECAATGHELGTYERAQELDYNATLLSF